MTLMNGFVVAMISNVVLSVRSPFSVVSSNFGEVVVSKTGEVSFSVTGGRVLTSLLNRIPSVVISRS